MKKFLSIILAVVMLVAMIPATFVSAAEGDTAVEHEYKIVLGSFNTSDLPTSTGAVTTAPTLRNGNILYYKDVMNYWTTIQGTQTTSGNPIDPFFNSSASDEWGLINCNFTRSGARLGSSYLFAEHANDCNGRNVTLKIKVSAPGEYFLQTKVGFESSATVNYEIPVTNVYFFKDGTEGVTNTNYATFPAKVGTLHAEKNKYVTVAKVNVEEAGEYIVSYVASSAYPLAASTQAVQFSLSGVKLAPVANDEITGVGFELGAKTLGKYRSVSAKTSTTGTVSGKMNVAASEFDFVASPSGKVEIAADGTITALEEGAVTITATYKADPTLSATATLEILPNVAAHEQTFVFGKPGFNTDKMMALDDANYGGKPVIRERNGAIYLQAMFDWAYEVSGTYSKTGEAFMALDTTEDDGDAKLTDRWAFAGYNQHLGAPYVGDNFAMQVMPTKYTNNPAVIAFRLNIDAAGKYDLKIKAGTQAAGAGFATYFAKESDVADIKTAASYPASAKLEYFDVHAAKDYVDLGEVTVKEPGDYIIAFFTDSTSESFNSNVLTQNSDKYQWFQLNSIKLVPAEYNYVFAHKAHISTALNGPYTPGYVSGGTDIRKGTAFENVGFADTDYTVSSGAWGNKDLRPTQQAVAFRSSLAIHRTGNFVNLTMLGEAHTDEEENTTYNFIGYDSVPGGTSTYPALMIAIDVPMAGRYNPSFTIGNSGSLGQKYEIFLVKYDKKYDDMEAWEVREALKPADRVGCIDSSVGGTQALEEIYLQDSPYFVVIVPAGAGANSGKIAKDTTEIVLSLQSFKLSVVDAAAEKSQALLDREAAALLDDGNPEKEALDTASATVNVLARAVGTDAADDDIADVIATETVLAGGTYTTPEAPEIEGYTFLYWGRGLGTNMRPVSTDATATIKAAKGANYIAAFYSKNDASDAVVEFYNANGDLVDRTRYEDGEEIEIPALPSLTGVGTSIGWTMDGGETIIGTDEVVEADGPIMAFFAVYDDAAIAKNIEITASGSTGIIGAGTYAFGDRVELNAPKFKNGSDSDMFLYWKKGDEIVSFERYYAFNASTSCNVEAVYAKYGPTAVEEICKAVVSEAGNIVVAEFIGCEEAIERGFIFGGTGIEDATYRQPMKTDSKSFTMTNDTSLIAKAYAIFTNGVIYSK